MATEELPYLIRGRGGGGEVGGGKERTKTTQKNSFVILSKVRQVRAKAWLKEPHGPDLQYMRGARVTGSSESANYFYCLVEGGKKWGIVYAESG